MVKKLIVLCFLLYPLSLSASAAQFREFLPGITRYSDVKKAIESPSVKKYTYSDTKYVGTHIIQTKSELFEKVVPINMFFYNGILVEIDIAVPYFSQAISETENYLNQTYGMVKRHGYYDYPNIEQGYNHACNAWGENSHLEWYEACARAEVVIGKYYSTKSDTELLGIGYLGIESKRNIESVLTYRNWNLNRGFQSYHGNILKHNQYKQEQDQANKAKEYL